MENAFGAGGSQRVLITGATGLLGREVMRAFEGRGWDVRGLGFSRATGAVVKCNLFEKAELEAQFEEYRPTVVIHCAAERRPDKLEGNTAEATRINVAVTRTIGELCKAQGAWLIYLSTNYVFDGKQAPYAEDATPCPPNIYGESKLNGELALKEVCPSAAIVRVPLLYGPIEYVSETSVTVLLDTIQQAAPKLDNWQERFPTSTEDVALVLEAMTVAYVARGKVEPQSFSGIFHWQANERHTKYTMALAIAHIAKVDTAKFVRVDSAPAPGSAPRPQFERMLCDRLETLLEIKGRQTGLFRTNFEAGMARALRPFISTEPDLEKHQELSPCAGAFGKGGYAANEGAVVKCP